MNPLDSVTFKISGNPIKLCYGRPSLRGRTMVIGQVYPYGRVWRTGANEPTIFFTPVTLSLAGLTVPAGKYSLYTVPGETEWEIIVNRSTSQWGSTYNSIVQAQELGRVKVKREQLQTAIEQFTIRPDNATNAKMLLLEWQNFRVPIPITAAPASGTPAFVPSPPDTACPKLISPPEGDTLPDPTRMRSPLDSVTFKVTGKAIKVCYGRPSLRGRVMIGRNIPYGRLWRTGANEPTIVFTPIPLSIAGLKVPAGKYALYTIPGPTEWTLVVNRSTSQWGFEGYYNAHVKSQELQHMPVRSEALEESIERFTIRPDAVNGEAKALLLEWEKIRVRIPVAGS